MWDVNLLTLLEDLEVQSDLKVLKSVVWGKTEEESLNKKNSFSRDERTKRISSTDIHETYQ